MTKNELLQTLTAIQTTLDHVSICGRQNLEYMRNSMAALEHVTKEITNMDIEPPQEE